MKRFISIVFALALVLSIGQYAFAANPSLSNFKKNNQYEAGTFKDIDGNAWYADYVRIAYETGLVKGNSETSFNPTGNMTIAEAITLASRLNSYYYNGSAEFTQGTPWYQVYVDYAVNAGIVAKGQFKNYNSLATRAQFASIFGKAFPETALQAINLINSGDVPDVSGIETYSGSVYLLYNAGVLTGSDKYGTFNPNSNITRSEVATITTRMADSGLRKTFMLEIPATDVSLSSTARSLKTGETAALTATILPSNVTDKTTFWKSSNLSVATVSSAGVVTGIKDGVAIITVLTANGKTATCTISVETDDDSSDNNTDTNNNTSPAAPTNFTAVAYSADKATLSWSAVTGATSYEVQYYRRATSAWTKDADYISGTSYISTSLIDYDSYQYRVRAVNSIGSSEWASVTYTKPSTTVAVPAAPTNFTAVAYSADKATLSWNAVTGATSYEVQYYRRATSAWTKDADYSSGTSYISTSLIDYDSYQYRVRAVNSVGSSSCCC